MLSDEVRALLNKPPSGLSACAKGKEEDKFAFAFQLYDINGDQSLDREELRTLLRAYLVAARKMASQAVEVVDIEDFDEDGK